MNEIDIKYYKKESFDTKTYRNNIKTLKSLKIDSESVFFDIGCHRGEELELLKDTGCQVHAFECNPLHFENLTSIYGEYKNIKLIKALVTNVNGKEKRCYWKKTGKGGSMSEEASKTASSNSYIHVKTLLLSDYIIRNNIEKIDFIKMDVEGSEFKIIEDLIDTGIISRVGAVYLEDHFMKIKCKKWQKHRVIVKQKMLTTCPEIFYKWE